LTDVIEVAEDRIIHIAYTDFNLAHDYADFVKITEENGNELQPAYGSNLPDPIYSTTNKVFVRFKTDGRTSGTGFRLVWTEVDPTATTTTTTTTTEAPPIEHAVTSPNFPRNYGNYANSRYPIEVDPGNRIHIRFTDFSTESSYDFVKITDEDGTELMSRKSGSSRPSALTSNTNKVVVRFTSDGSGTRRGFRLVWTVVRSTNSGPDIKSTGSSLNTTTAILLKSTSEYLYYKVPVPANTRLTEGKVADTCDSVGMKAVCDGPSSCKNTDTARCVVTPISIRCGYPLRPVSQLVCNHDEPTRCAPLEGVFAYQYNRSKGECGRVGSSYCANGNEYVSTVSTQFYALCAI